MAAAASSSSLFLLVSLLFLSILISSSKPIILPLKTQQTPSGSLPKPPTKLFFHHNVSLTVSLSVGTPPQPVSMVLDTGSELPWLRCNASQTAPSFHPHLSSSFSPTLCNSSTCKTQTRDLQIPPSCDPNHLCHVTLSYADASSSAGNLASDTFSVGSSASPNTVFGCMDSTVTSSAGEDAGTAGLLGMNRGSLSFVSQLGFPKFSYCISGRGSGGILVLGGSGTSSNLSFTPLIRIPDPLPYFDRVAYSVQLEGIRVSTKLLQLPKSVFVPDHTGAGQTMVDSGTQFTFLLGPVYTALKKEFTEQTSGLLRVLKEPNFVFQGAMDLCFLIAESGRVPDLPEVVLVFRGAEMSVSGERLLYRVEGERRGGEAVYCFTFGNSDLIPIEAYVIGHHHQRNMWVEYDLEQDRVGFGPASCDLAAKRLGVGLV
ncbi:aspartic proteinase PCS1 [Cinnamomum micranthum f. kanehirae]|uniref:Aspartic proteinase PCS1 n=1 Tax=Cinnamomum micranthum f. kanehirae TaxID=337451 RepID=A0A443NSV8_9MAGN|nr:aspartic proteinase PCS1 [Cinnamomum micranthum f. kanehirae]